MTNKAFEYQEPFPLSEDETDYYLLSKEYISTTEFEGREILKVKPQALTLIAQQAVHDASYFLRSAHQYQVAQILYDPEASENDKYVALQLLRNAEISAKGILPNCQDTGTATIVAKKGQQVWTGVNDAKYLSHGIYNTFQRENLRYSQNAALDMYHEVNTGTNLPAQIDILANEGAEYHFLFINKGGGSANKTALYQETKAILEHDRLKAFLIDKMKYLGTTACPPYHIAFCIGGTSPEMNLKTVKLASTKYYDNLPDTGNEHGRAFRDRELEQELLDATREFGFGAQFGGKYFAHDIRIIRLPRHGGSCPIGLALSCSSDRNIKGKITKDGIWLERLEYNPASYIPEFMCKENEGNTVKIDLNRPMAEILKELSQYPVSTRVSLSGPLIVARDIAHMKLKEPGGSGAQPHLAWCREIILELAKEENLTFKMALIPADVDKKIVHEALDAGKITPLHFVPELTHEAIDESTYIVAQMGIEPFQEALAAGAQVVLAGRSYDPCCFAALPIMKGFDEGLALHCGKILECAAIAATPGSGSDCAMGVIDETGFTLKAFNPIRKFTKTSAAAHTLYEKSDPYTLPGPGGVLDLKECKFEDLGNGQVRVTGSRHVSTPYTVKLEAARPVGYRTITIAGTHDPIMIAGIDKILVEVLKSVEKNLSIDPGSVKINFHLYGKNGVMGQAEPETVIKSYELGILLDVVAPTQEQADSVCSLARSTMLHYGYDGRIATAGNLAFPFSPSDIQAGKVYEFSIYHLMEYTSDIKFKFQMEQVTPQGVTK